MNIAKSFFSLVKYNNGMFKSEKQAAFLLSKVNADTNEFYVEHGNAMFTVFAVDRAGVKFVNKITTVKGQRVWTTVFDRNDPTIAEKCETLKVVKAEKALARRIQARIDGMKKRLASRSNYEGGSELLYNRSMKDDAAFAGITTEDFQLFTGTVVKACIIKRQIKKLKGCILIQMLESMEGTRNREEYRQREIAFDKFGKIVANREARLNQLRY